MFNPLSLHLSKRSLQAESMDQPSLPTEELQKALRGLHILNNLSRVSTTIWKTIKIWKQKSQNTKLRILDIACGSGEILSSVVKKGLRDFSHIEALGLDINPKIIEYAKEKNIFNKKLLFKQGNALLPIDKGFNVIFSTLFLHHLREEEIITLFQNMNNACKGIVIIHDLKRSYVGFYVALIASRLFSSSPIVRADALLSIRAAFKKEEILQLLSKAKINNATIIDTWPCRMLITWEPSQS